MWSGPIHDTEFVTRVLEHLELDKKEYGTAVRMRGMLTVAKEVSNDLFAKGKLYDGYSST
jgi:tRNA G26 N,N-dimethylase Trm1